MTLAGRRILVTRAAGGASRLAEMLSERGAEPWLLPAIEIVAPNDLQPLRKAVSDLDKFDWILFTSANGVRALLEVASAESRPLPGEWPLLAAIGPATSDALATGWRPADLIPPRYLSTDFVTALGNLQGKRVLLPQGDLASRDTPNRLVKSGAEVTLVEAYRTIAAPWPPHLNGKPDVITFTSSSCVLATHERLVERGLLGWLTSVPIACIGPVTAETLQDLGGTPAEVARESTLEGLVAAVERIVSARKAHV